jgi:indolepyruvate ferredoxin oxidoreductase beta subunit
MRVRTTGFWGFLRLRLLAGLRFMRPRSLRAAEENAWIERWLSLIERAHRIDPEAAREIIESASLARGYGDTWKRGHANWARIADEIVEPMLAAPSPRFADAVLQARIAANADPEGKRLAAVIESLAKLKAA